MIGGMNNFLCFVSHEDWNKPFYLGFQGSMTVRVLVDSGQCINITCSPSTTGEELRTEAAKIAHVSVISWVLQ